MNRVASLCVILALMFCAAPRVVVVDNTSATHWFRCAFSGSCIPQMAYEVRRKAETPTVTTTDTATSTTEPPKTTTNPVIVNK